MIVHTMWQIFMQVDADEMLKLLTLRNSLEGTARLLLTRGAVTYDELKAALIAEFGRSISRPEVYQALRNRIKKPTESIRRYIMEMEAIARKSDVTQFELVAFIQEGLNRRIPDYSLFATAKTIGELKQAVNMFEQRQALRNPDVKSDAPIAKLMPKVVTTTPPQPQDRCFNCSRTGHRKPDCPYEERPRNVCFNCWKPGHDHKSCRNPKYMQKTKQVVAVCSAEEEDVVRANEEGWESLNSLQLVRVCFENASGIRSETYDRFCLLDTGSPVNLVRRSVVPFVIADETKKTKFYGLGRKEICAYGEVSCFVNIRKRREKLKLFVVSDESIPVHLLLGRDALKTFHIELKFTDRRTENLCFNKKPVDRSDLCFCILNTAVANEISLDRPSALSASAPDHIAESTYQFEVRQIMMIENVADSNEIDISPQLEKGVCENIKKLILDEYLSREPEVQPDYEMKINLTSDVPFHFAPRKLSYKEREALKEITDKLLESGVIRHSDSAYASPVVMVQKKSGEYRKCVDYRCLNKMTIRDNYPLPLIEDCLHFFSGKSYFSTLDLKNGFYHVKVAEESKKYTSFVTPYGQFEYNQMAPGLTNAPALFQRYINLVLKELIDSQLVIVYMDDILVASETLAQHMEDLKKVLNVIARVGLELNLKKCKFVYQQVDFLGYSVSHSGISQSAAHVKAITNYPMPKSLKDVRTCLGLFSYFRKFIPRYAQVAHPLQKLLRTGVQFEINDECVQAFQSLKNCLMSPPVLAIFDRTKETELHTDASKVGYGVVLLQRQADGKFHPVFYFSKAATADESRYHSFEQEALAIVYSLERFRTYLHGISFKVVTDCSALSLTFEKKNICPRIARWAVDTLSRCHPANGDEDRDFHTEIMSRVVSVLTGAGQSVCENNPHDIEDNNFENCEEESVDALPCRVVSVADQTELDFMIQVAQNRDETVLSLRRQLEEGDVCGYELKDGLVFQNSGQGALQLFVPREMEGSVIRMIHEKICHFGIEKTSEQVRKNYWFKNMKEKIDRFVKNCIRCIMCSPPVRAESRNLFNIPKAPVPFDTLHVDHFGPLPSISSTRKHLFVVVDAFTKFVKLYAVKSTSTKEVIACLLKYFLAYSRPRRIISDRGTCFTSLQFSEFLLDQNIDHVKVAVASAQANGQVERVNRVLKTMLSKITEPVSHADWAELLYKVEYALNNSTHSSSKQTPSQLLFGVDQRGQEIDLLTEHLQGKTGTERDLESIRKDASAAITNSQSVSAKYFAQKHKPPPVFAEGEFVVIRHTDTTVGSNKKFVEKYRGPYIIHKVLPHDRYVVRDIENCQLTQLPYDGVIEASRIRRGLAA